MIKVLLPILLALLSLSRIVEAQSCSTWPVVNLTNNTTADATQVMANFLCAAPIVSPHFTGNVGIGTVTPNAKLTLGTNIYSAPLGSSYGQYQMLLYDGGAPSNSYGLGIEPYNIGLNSAGGYKFYQLSGTTPLMMVGGNGSTNVGIGTATPNGKLTIGNNVSTGPLGSSSYGQYQILLYDGGSSNYSYGVGLEPYNISLNSAGGYKFYQLSGTTPLMVVGGNGSTNVGIGTSSPAYSLDVRGTVYATGAAGALSDIRHKKDIIPLSDGALAQVLELRPVAFSWKTPADDGMKGRQIGFIAQDVERVLPTTVLTQSDPDQTRALKYNEIVAVLTKAMQEQQGEIARLEKTLKDQKIELQRSQKQQQAEVRALQSQLTAIKMTQVAALQPQK